MDKRSSIGGITDHSILITKMDFTCTMQRLQQQRLWVEGAARRSSMGFEAIGDDNSAFSRFISALSNNSGVCLRRHQSGCISEMVVLFSNDVCDKIGWTPR